MLAMKQDPCKPVITVNRITSMQDEPIEIKVKGKCYYYLIYYVFKLRCHAKGVRRGFNKSLHGLLNKGQ